MIGILSENDEANLVERSTIECIEDEVSRWKDLGSLNILILKNDLHQTIQYLLVLLLQELP